MEANAIQVDPNDNVVVAFREVKAGESIIGIVGVDVKANEDITRNHKIAIREISENSAVIKYGETIALASNLIRPGDWVHTHNLKSKETD